MFRRQPEDNVGEFVADREPLPLGAVLAIDADVFFVLVREVVARFIVS